MRLANVSARHIKDVGKALWGTGMSTGTVVNLDKKAFRVVGKWRADHRLRLRYRLGPQDLFLENEASLSSKIEFDIPRKQSILTSNACSQIRIDTFGNRFSTPSTKTC